MDERGSIPDKGMNLSLLHRVHTDSESHPIGTGDYFPRDKVARE